VEMVQQRQHRILVHIAGEVGEETVDTHGPALYNARPWRR
jgi:hypothetical protein